jgi:hypothetical protein
MAAHRGQVGPRPSVGLTDLVHHVTCLRGYALLHPLNQSEAVRPRHTIAHELGHILAETHDEGVAERKAQELLRTAVVAAAGN